MVVVGKQVPERSPTLDVLSARPPPKLTLRYLTSFIQSVMADESKINLSEFIENLMMDPKREPVASELGGASCLSRCRT